MAGFIEFLAVGMGIVPAFARWNAGFDAPGHKGLEKLIAVITIGSFAEMTVGWTASIARQARQTTDDCFEQWSRTCRAWPF